MKTLFYALAVVLVLPVALVACSPGGETVTTTATSPAPSGTTNATGEIEAVEFQGVALTPLHLQRNNALAGTQYIDRDTYVLIIDGLVDRPLSLTYEDLLALPQYDRLMPLDCVEGWSFAAKWTGPSLKDIFEMAGVQPEAKIAIFYTTDASTGYTSLEVPYIMDNDILIALKDNDITLPPERGFPFQVAAMSKFGYKWAKWVTRIELSDNIDFKGFWENYGYNNNADVDGPAFEPK